MTDRGPDGKFIPGNKASPGRAPKAREERYYEITMTACSYKDWEEITKTAVRQAKKGDPVARKWLSEYLVGKPEENLNGAIEILVRYAEKDD